MLNRFIETGKIVGTHGIKGEVRVQPWSDSREFLTNFKSFYLDGEGKELLKARAVRPHGNVVIISFKGIASIEQAEKLRGKIIYINRNDVDLPDGRYFVSDLIGCTVTDADTGAALGRLSEVSQTGVNDVWHIMRDGREYLVPAVEEVVISVDVDNSKVIIRPIKGIFDDED